MAGGGPHILGQSKACRAESQTGSVIITQHTWMFFYNQRSATTLSPLELAYTWWGPSSLPIKEKRQLTWGGVQRLTQGHLVRKTHTEFEGGLNSCALSTILGIEGACDNRWAWITSLNFASPSYLFLVALCDDRNDLSPTLGKFHGLVGKTRHVTDKNTLCPQGMAGALQACPPLQDHGRGHSSTVASGLVGFLHSGSELTVVCPETGEPGGYWIPSMIWFPVTTEVSPWGQTFFKGRKLDFTSWRVSGSLQKSCFTFYVL